MNQEENKELTIHVKKSSLHAKDAFDYQKLAAMRPYFLPCQVTEELEELRMTFDLKGKRPLREIHQESKETKYQLLINFALLEAAALEYQVTFTEENLYYDENNLLYIRERDLYEVGKGADGSQFLEDYKCFAGGILSGRYEVSQLQKSGISILKNKKSFSAIYQSESPSAIVSILRERKETWLTQTRRKKKEVSRRAYWLWRTVAVLAVLLCVGVSIYAYDRGMVTVPKQTDVIAANEAYLIKDYVSCIDSLRTYEADELDASTQYILAVSYARSESFQKEEIETVVARLSPVSSEKELQYWILLGRLDMNAAQDLALSLSDDKLLIYAYMKELDLLDANTAMSGAEKKARTDELTQEIERLGEKYNPNE